MTHLHPCRATRSRTAPARHIRLPNPQHPEVLSPEEEQNVNRPGNEQQGRLQALHDAFANSGDAEFISTMIDEIVDPDVKNHAPAEATGTQVLKELFARLHRVYPDLHVTVEDMIEEDGKVAGRNTLTGTHQGEYMGLAPTGRSVTYNEIIIFRFVNGRITETWGVVDVFAQMKQLGLIPSDRG